MHALSTQTELSALRELVRIATPVASVYTGEAEALDAGAHPRWHALSRRLSDQGADPETVAALADHLAALADPYQLMVFASDGAVRLVRRLPGAEGADRADFGAPARVLPVLGWQQEHPAHVLVVIDRAGADVTSVPAGAPTGATVIVAGPDDEIEHKAPGGWSQPRYHRRAVDSWHHNAAAVAETAAYAVDRIDAGLLLLAGDVRATQLFREHLPHGLRTRLDLRAVPGGRSADGSWPARQAAVEAALRSYVEDESRHLRDRVIADLGPGGRAVDGVEHTLAALAEGRVETLLVTDSPADDRMAWFGPAVLCADMPRPDGSTRVTGRLVDVATRAALLTDAHVRVLTPGVAAGLAEGVGAVCRFA